MFFIGYICNVVVTISFSTAVSCPTYHSGVSNTAQPKISMGVYTREKCEELCIKMQILYRPEVTGLDWHASTEQCYCILLQTSRSSSTIYHNCVFTASGKTTSLFSLLLFNVKTLL